MHIGIVLHVQRNVRNTLTSKHDITRHPDTNMCLEGEIESIERVLGIAIDAHEKLCPEVPVGWDVSFTKLTEMLCWKISRVISFEVNSI